MRVKRRSKGSRHRGTRTYSRGKKNRTRGSGNQGGVGMGGTGKRGDAKKTLVLKLYGNKYFKKDLSVSKRLRKTITLETIEMNMSGLIKQGIAKENKGTYELDLKKHKIIGDTKVSMPLKIHAKGASKNALASIQQAGGELILDA